MSPAPTRAVVSERKIIRWAQEQLAGMREIALIQQLPDADATMARLAVLASKRERIVDMYADGTLTKVERDQRLPLIAAERAMVDATGEARSGTFFLTPAVDWDADPSAINAAIRKLWSEVILNGGLVPRRAIWWPLVGEPAAGEVEELLRGGDGPPRISAANVAEIIDVLVRFRSQGIELIGERLDWLIAGGLQVTAVDDGSARRAGSIRARHYHARQRPISLADCLALATALALDDVLATSDPHLLDTATAEGCRVRALPDSRGVNNAVEPLPDVPRL